MTDHPPPDRSTPSTEGLGTVPEWLRQPPAEVTPDLADRWRIWASRHSGKLLAGTAAALLLAFFGLVGTTTYRSFQRWGQGPAPYPTISQPPGEQASTSASPPAAAGPFDDTPAAAFPEGAAGIALPTARRAGPFTEKQVATTLAKVRKALVTARLNRAFITSEDPEALIRQLAPDARGSIREDFTSGSFGSYATRLGPGARLTKHQPRVNGRVTYRATRDSGGIRMLEVTTNFVWVYALQTTSTVPGDGLIVVHDTVIWHLPHPADVRDSSNGLWLWDADAYVTNVDCVDLNKGLLKIGTPTFGGPASTEDPDAVYDPDRSLEATQAC